MEEEKIKCIYYIKDLRTDKIIYIGQTINFNGRKAYHFYNKICYIDKYMFEEGRENFSMEKFDIDCTNMTEEERKIKEQELIILYDTINNGFNKNKSGLISKNQKEYKADYMRNYLKTNDEYKEKQKQLLKQYYQKHKEKKRQYGKEYYQKHKEEIKQYNKEYKENNKEKCKQYGKEYYQKHKK